MNKYSKDLLQPTGKSKIIIEVSYRRYVVDYEKGLQIIAAFEGAEVLDNASTYKAIYPMNRDRSPEFHTMSEDEYIALKLSNLLKTEVDVDSLSNLEVIRNDLEEEDDAID